MFNNIKLFFLSVFAEYKKVTWPNRDEVVNVTMLVGVLVVFFSIYIGLVDFLLTIILGFLLRLK
jgi:preprotein translocase subunit SecE